jgi:hypothetical protein
MTTTANDLKPAPVVIAHLSKQDSLNFSMIEKVYSGISQELQKSWAALNPHVYMTTTGRADATTIPEWDTKTPAAIYSVDVTFSHLVFTRSKSKNGFDLLPATFSIPI